MSAPLQGCALPLPKVWGRKRTRPITLPEILKVLHQLTKKRWLDFAPTMPTRSIFFYKGTPASSSPSRSGFYTITADRRKSYRRCFSRHSKKQSFLTRRKQPRRHGSRRSRFIGPWTGNHTVSIRLPLWYRNRQPRRYSIGGKSPGPGSGNEAQPTLREKAFRELPEVQRRTLELFYCWPGMGFPCLPPIQ
jgi:hypothetical protein